MKIADPENIKAGEQDLIDTIREKVDLQVIEDVVARQVSLKDLEFNEGDIVIHEGAVAYRLDFTVHMGVSILFDREGNLLSGASVGQGDPEDGEAAMVDDVTSVDDLTNEISLMDDAGDVESEQAPVSELEGLLSRNRDYWTEKVDGYSGEGQV